VRRAAFVAFLEAIVVSGGGERWRCLARYRLSTVGGEARARALRLRIPAIVQRADRVKHQDRNADFTTE